MELIDLQDTQNSVIERSNETNLKFIDDLLSIISMNRLSTVVFVLSTSIAFHFVLTSFLLNKFKLQIIKALQIWKMLNHQLTIKHSIRYKTSII